MLIVFFKILEQVAWKYNTVKYSHPEQWIFAPGTVNTHRADHPVHIFGLQSEDAESSSAQDGTTASLSSTSS